MINLDMLIHQKLQLLEKEEKDLNPFFVSKEKVMTLLTKKSKEQPQLFERLQLLSQLFNLNEKERDILWIVMAPLCDLKYQKVYAYLQDDLNKKEATVFLLSLLLTEKDEEESNLYAYLQPSAPLIAFQLLELDSTQQSLHISTSVQSFLLGTLCGYIR